MKINKEKAYFTLHATCKELTILLLVFQMKKYYKTRYDYPEFFCKGSPLQYKHLLPLNIMSILNVRDKKGRMIGIYKQGKW